MLEWALVSVDLLHFMDGRFLVDFYTCNPVDKVCIMINQHYWLEYHPALEVAMPYYSQCAHMIFPSAQPPSYVPATAL